MLTFFLTVNAVASEDKEFEQFLKEENDAFSSYIEEQEKDFEKYKAEIMQKWGEFVGSTQKEWVHYAEDKMSRSYVDFENGKVTIDVIMPVEQKQPLKIAEKKIKNQIKQTLSNTWPTHKNPLAGQVLVQQKKEVLSQKNVDTFVQKELKKKLKVTKLSPTKDKVQKQKISVTFDMVPNHLKVRAEQYKPMVLKYSTTRNIDPSVIFGMIHTESCFNPMARSHIPAYGLMQIVPRSGGVDAYEYVYKKKKIPTPELLYQPDFNIRLGVAYVDKIKNVYFKAVENETSAYLMTVAAYNTGIGNVSKAFTGKTIISPAVQKANTMTFKQVHQQLMGHLTYKEPKDYIQRVFSRSKMYR